MATLQELIDDAVQARKVRLVQATVSAMNRISQDLAGARVLNDDGTQASAGIASVLQGILDGTGVDGLPASVDDRLRNQVLGELELRLETSSGNITPNIHG